MIEKSAILIFLQGCASASVDYKTASPFNKIPAEPFRNLIVRKFKILLYNIDNFGYLVIF